MMTREDFMMSIYDHIGGGGDVGEGKQPEEASEDQNPEAQEQGEEKEQSVEPAAEGAGGDGDEEPPRRALSADGAPGAAEAAGEGWRPCRAGQRCRS